MTLYWHKRAQSRYPRARQSIFFALGSASAYRRAKNIGIIAVIVAERKLRDIERQILAADLVVTTHNSAFNQRSKTLKGHLPQEAAESLLEYKIGQHAVGAIHTNTAIVGPDDPVAPLRSSQAQSGRLSLSICPSLSMKRTVNISPGFLPD
jgi:hypothetical protein